MMKIPHVAKKKTSPWWEGEKGKLEMETSFECLQLIDRSIFLSASCDLRSESYTSHRYKKQAMEDLESLDKLKTELQSLACCLRSIYEIINSLASTQLHINVTSIFISFRMQHATDRNRNKQMKSRWNAISVVPSIGRSRHFANNNAMRKLNCIVNIWESFLFHCRF